MGTELLEHVWNARLDDVAIASMPFFCYEKK